MSRNNRIQKPIALIALLAFAAQDLAFAAPDAAALAGSFASARPTAQNFGIRIPESIAAFEDAHRASGSTSRSKTIYLLQDAHTNASGQFNTAKALERLVADRRFDHVFLEGGTGDDSLSFLRPLAPASDRAAKVRPFVHKGVLSGAEYLDVAGDLPIRLWGVEDPGLYREALASYRAVTGGREKASAVLARLSAACDFLKERDWSPSARDFDRLIADEREGRISTAQALSRTLAAARGLGISVTGYAHLRRLEKISRKESSVDFDRARQEWDRALGLLDARGAARPDLAFVTQPSEPAVQSARAAALREALGKSGIRRNDLPELFDYFDLAAAAARLHFGSVLAERAALEEAVWERLTAGPDARALHRAAGAVEALTALLRMRITPSEFEKASRNPWFGEPAALMGYFNRRWADLETAYEKTLLWDDAFAEQIAQAKKFYSLTLRRDEVMVRQIIRKMDEEQASEAALIAGGYHAPNLKRLLRENGFSYVSLLPQVLHPTDHARYEKILLAQTLDRTSGSGPVSAHAIPPAAAAERPGVAGTVAGVFVADGEAFAGRALAGRIHALEPRRPAVGGARLSIQQRIEKHRQDLEQIRIERSNPGQGRLRSNIVISDPHGSIDRFNALILDSILQTFDDRNPLRGLEGNQEQKVRDELIAVLEQEGTAELLSYLGISVEEAQEKIRFHNLGDLMDRGEYGVKVYRRSKELIELGLSDFIIGNHDLWEFLNLQGYHLPFYEGFNFYGYTDAYDETLGNVRDLVRAAQESDPDTRSASWWAEKLFEYNDFHAKKQKNYWDSFQKRAQQMFEEIAPRLKTDEEKYVWNKLRGWYMVDVYTGTRSVGTMSLQWWKELRDGLHDPSEPSRNFAGFEELSEKIAVDDPSRKYWMEAIQMIEDITREVQADLEGHLKDGEWWWRVFEAVNYRNYESVEWWAKDWAYHKDWGTAVFDELNKEIGSQVWDQSNYFRHSTLTDIGEFFRDNFSLYEVDDYGTVNMHAFLPVDEQGRFHFTYRGVQYAGKGDPAAGIRSVWEGLDQIAEDVRDRSNSPRELYEAFSLINSWYADNTTRAKPEHVAYAMNHFSPEQLAEANGFVRLVTGHIPFFEFSKLPTSKRGIVKSWFTSGIIAFADHGMGKLRFQGAGSVIVSSRAGMYLRGFEHRNSDRIVQNPRTVDVPKGSSDPDGPTLFENPPYDRDAFLASSEAALILRIQELESRLAGARMAIALPMPPTMKREIFRRIHSALDGIAIVLRGLREEEGEDAPEYQRVRGQMFYVAGKIESAAMALVVDPPDVADLAEAHATLASAWRVLADLQRSVNHRPSAIGIDHLNQDLWRILESLVDYYGRKTQPRDSRFGYYAEMSDRVQAVADAITAEMRRLKDPAKYPFSKFTSAEEVEEIADQLRRAWLTLPGILHPEELPIETDPAGGLEEHELLQNLLVEIDIAIEEMAAAKYLPKEKEKGADDIRRLLEMFQEQEMNRPVALLQNLEIASHHLGEAIVALDPEQIIAPALTEALEPFFERVVGGMDADIQTELIDPADAIDTPTGGPVVPDSGLTAQALLSPAVRGIPSEQVEAVWHLMKIKVVLDGIRYPGLRGPEMIYPGIQDALRVAPTAPNLARYLPQLPVFVRRLETLMERSESESVDSSAGFGTGIGLIYENVPSHSLSRVRTALAQIGKDLGSRMAGAPVYQKYSHASYNRLSSVRRQAGVNPAALVEIKRVRDRMYIERAEKHDQLGASIFDLTLSDLYDWTQVNSTTITSRPIDSFSKERVHLLTRPNGKTYVVRFEESKHDPVLRLWREGDQEWVPYLSRDNDPETFQALREALETPDRVWPGQQISGLDITTLLKLAGILEQEPIRPGDLFLPADFAGRLVLPDGRALVVRFFDPDDAGHPQRVGVYFTNDDPTLGKSFYRFMDPGPFDLLLDRMQGSARMAGWKRIVSWIRIPGIGRAKQDLAESAADLPAGLTFEEYLARLQSLFETVVLKNWNQSLVAITKDSAAPFENLTNIARGRLKPPPTEIRVLEDYPAYLDVSGQLQTVMFPKDLPAGVSPLLVRYWTTGRIDIVLPAEKNAALRAPRTVEEWPLISAPRLPQGLMAALVHYNHQVVESETGVTMADLNFQQVNQAYEKAVREAAAKLSKKPAGGARMSQPDALQALQSGRSQSEDLVDSALEKVARIARSTDPVNAFLRAYGATPVSGGYSRSERRGLKALGYELDPKTGRPVAPSKAKPAKKRAASDKKLLAKNKSVSQPLQPTPSVQQPVQPAPSVQPADEPAPESVTAPAVEPSLVPAPPPAPAPSAKLASVSKPAAVRTLVVRKLPEPKIPAAILREFERTAIRMREASRHQRIGNWDRAREGYAAAFGILMGYARNRNPLVEARALEEIRNFYNLLLASVSEQLTAAKTGSFPYEQDRMTLSNDVQARLLQISELMNRLHPEHHPDVFDLHHKRLEDIVRYQQAAIAILLSGRPDSKTPRLRSQEKGQEVVDLINRLIREEAPTFPEIKGIDHLLAVIESHAYAEAKHVDSYKIKLHSKGGEDIHDYDAMTADRRLASLVAHLAMTNADANAGLRSLGEKGAKPLRIQSDPRLSVEAAAIAAYVEDMRILGLEAEVIPSADGMSWVARPGVTKILNKGAIRRLVESNNLRDARTVTPAFDRVAKNNGHTQARALVRQILAAQEAEDASPGGARMASLTDDRAYRRWRTLETGNFGMLPAETFKMAGRIRENANSVSDADLLGALSTASFFTAHAGTLELAAELSRRLSRPVPDPSLLNATLDATQLWTGQAQMLAAWALAKADRIRPNGFVSTILNDRFIDYAVLDGRKLPLNLDGTVRDFTVRVQEGIYPAFGTFVVLDAPEGFEWKKTGWELKIGSWKSSISYGSMIDLNRRTVGFVLLQDISDIVAEDRRLKADDLQRFFTQKRIAGSEVQVHLRNRGILEALLKQISDISPAGSELIADRIVNTDMNRQIREGGFERSFIGRALKKAGYDYDATSSQPSIAAPYFKVRKFGARLAARLRMNSAVWIRRLSRHFHSAPSPSTRFRAQYVVRPTHPSAGSSSILAGGAVRTTVAANLTGEAAQRAYRRLPASAKSRLSRYAAGMMSVPDLRERLNAGAQVPVRLDGDITAILQIRKHGSRIRIHARIAGGQWLYLHTVPARRNRRPSGTQQNPARQVSMTDIQLAVEKLYGKLEEKWAADAAQTAVGRIDLRIFDTAGPTRLQDFSLVLPVILAEALAAQKDYGNRAAFLLAGPEDLRGLVREAVAADPRLNELFYESRTELPAALVDAPIADLLSSASLADRGADAAPRLVVAQPMRRTEQGMDLLAVRALVRLTLLAADVDPNDRTGLRFLRFKSAIQTLVGQTLTDDEVAGYVQGLAQNPEQLTHRYAIPRLILVPTEKILSAVRMAARMAETSA